MITIIGRSCFTTSAPTPFTTEFAARDIERQAMAAGYKMFSARRAEIRTEVERQLAPARAKMERREAEDAALLAAHPGATITHPLSEYPFTATRRVLAAELREALRLRKGDETTVTLRRYSVGTAAGCADEVRLAG